MGWYLSSNGVTTGPYDDNTLMQLCREGRLTAASPVMPEGGQWTTIAQSPFGAFVGPAPVATTAASEGGSEALGYVLLVIPLISTILTWFWVGTMNLFQDPAGSLGMLTIGTILVTATLAAVEASQLGMGKKLDSSGKKGSGPVAWFFGNCLLWLVAFPWYLHERRKYGRHSLVVGGLLVALVFTGSVFVMGSAIESKKAEIRRSLDRLGTSP